MSSSDEWKTPSEIVPPRPSARCLLARAKPPPGAPAALPLAGSTPESGPAVRTDTKQFKSRAARTVSSIQARREGSQELGFSPREFVLCGLPIKRPKELVHHRQNGNYHFEVVGRPGVGLPFGQDRLVPLWLATAFKLCGQPVDNAIRFRSASDILRAFDIDDGGRAHRRLRGALERVFGASYFAWDDRDGRRKIEEERFQLVRKMSLWFTNDSHANQFTLWQNVIVLDSAFADDLRTSAIPIDFNTVRALKANPNALDFYIWQAHRCWELARLHRNSIRVPVFGAVGLLAQFGASIKSDRKARQSVRRWLSEVRTVWPECPNRLTEDGNYLVVRPAKAVNSAKILLPGVSAHPPLPLLPAQVTQRATGGGRAASEHLELDQAAERPLRRS